MNKHGDPHIILINKMSQTHYKWNNILKYLLLKFTKKVHITTHLLFGFSVSSFLWGSRAQLGIGNGIGEMRVESARWEELWSWGLGEKRCGYEEEGVHVHWGALFIMSVRLWYGYEEEGVRVQNFILGLSIQSCLCCCPVRMMLLISESCETHVRF